MYRLVKCLVGHAGWRWKLLLQQQLAHLSSSILWLTTVTPAVLLLFVSVQPIGAQKRHMTSAATTNRYRPRQPSPAIIWEDEAGKMTWKRSARDFSPPDGSTWRLDADQALTVTVKMSLLPPKAIVITAFGTKNVNSFAMSDIEEVFTDGGGQPRKRKRLTHLSADEKILRR